MNYIGSKLSLLSFIDSVVENLDLNEDVVFCDIFAGTGAVSKYFKKKGYRIISNDIQNYSYVTIEHLIGNNFKLKFEKLSSKAISPFYYLNNLSGEEGFIYNNYSDGGTKYSQYNRLYFTDDNSKKIDAIRSKIEDWKKEELINKNEYNYLIASLIESADKVANTASVYEAFLKKIKKSAQKELVLTPLETITSNVKHEIYNEDANKLIRKIKGDILYLDPPYNTRKYNTNYHMLETISLYDNPSIKGKAGVRIDDSKKSLYCSKRKAKDAFEDLIKNAKFKYILLSYNNEGIISIDDIRDIMSKYGNYKSYKKEYKRFKADRDSNRNHKERAVYEYIHCLEKNGED